MGGADGGDFARRRHSPSLGGTGSNGIAAGLDDEGEDGDVGWGDAWNGGGLGKVGGADGVEFLARLPAEGGDAPVVEPRRDGTLFLKFGAFGGAEFLLDIAAIAQFDLKRFNPIGRNPAIRAWQIEVGNARAGK